MPRQQQFMAPVGFYPGYPPTASPSKGYNGRISFPRETSSISHVRDGMNFNEPSSYSESSLSATSSTCQCAKAKKKKRKRHTRHSSRSSSGSSSRSRHRSKNEDDAFTCPFMEALKEISSRKLSKSKSKTADKKFVTKTGSSRIEVHFRKKPSDQDASEKPEGSSSSKTLRYKYRISLCPSGSQKSSKDEEIDQTDRDKAVDTHEDNANRRDEENGETDNEDFEELPPGVPKVLSITSKASVTIRRVKADD